MPGHLFISYSRKDGEEFALKLYDQLRTEGLSAWLDKYDLTSLTDLGPRIEGAIHECRVLLFVMTHDGVSDTCTNKQEWMLALRYGKPIVPLRIHPVDLPVQLGHLRWIDFTGDFKAGIGQLQKLLNEATSLGEISPSAIEQKNPAGTEERRDTGARTSPIIQLTILPPAIIYQTENQQRGTIYIGESEAIYKACADIPRRIQDLTMKYECDAGTGQSLNAEILKEFASAGKRVFETVFQDESTRNQIRTLLESYPQSKIVVREEQWIPWELMYDDCGSSEFILSNFWGYRYMILRAIKNPDNISKHLPPRPKVGLVKLDDIPQVKKAEHPHLIELHNNGKIELLDPLATLHGEMKRSEITRFRNYLGAALDIAHFACLLLPITWLDESFLLISDSFWIGTDDFAGLKFKNAPLVILNTRDNNSRQPMQLFNLVTTLLQQCGGVAAIVSDLPVPDTCAADFVEQFYTYLLERDQEVTRTLFETRKYCLNSNLNPFALLYALYVLDPNVRAGGSSLVSQPEVKMEEQSLRWPPILQINQRKYEVLGVNWEMISLLADQKILQRISKGIPDFRDRLYQVLAGREYDERHGEAKKLLTDMWNLEIGLVPYPFINVLSNFEFDRKYYTGYRDHLIHQLRVYLLGLYLYYGNIDIRTAINREFHECADPEDEFLRTWKIASFFHDLGYVFEIEREKTKGAYEEVVKGLNSFFEFPLLTYSKAHVIELLQAEEHDIQESSKLPRHRVDSIRDIETFRKKELLDQIEYLIKHTDLSNEPDGLARYYKYAKSNPPKDPKRSAFVDHGIAGALTLLHLQFFFEEYTSEVCRAIERQDVGDANALPKTIRELTGLRSTIEEKRRAVIHAGAAVALHNIQTDIWDPSDAYKAEKLTLDKYRLRLNGTPLAFLLALADTLQDWDRPLFSAPSEERRYISQDQDISISFSDRQIKLTFLDDDYRDTPKAKFKTLVAELKKFLSADDVDAFLVEGRKVGSA